MALNMRNEPDAPGAEYPLIQNNPHEDVVNETDIHFAQSDADIEEEIMLSDPPLLDPADEAAQQERLHHHRPPLTTERQV